MDLAAINTDRAPEALGPYSQAIEVSGFIFTSEQIPIDPATQEMVKGGIEAQAVRCLENIKAILEQSGSSMNKVVKTAIYLKDLANFPRVNEIYASYFEKPFPARSCVEVNGIPKGAEIGIEAVAVR